MLLERFGMLEDGVDVFEEDQGIGESQGTSGSTRRQRASSVVMGNDDYGAARAFEVGQVSQGPISTHRRQSGCGLLGMRGTRFRPDSAEWMHRTERTDGRLWSEMVELDFMDAMGDRFGLTN